MTFWKVPGLLAKEVLLLIFKHKQEEWASKETHIKGLLKYSLGYRQQGSRSALSLSLIPASKYFLEGRSYPCLGGWLPPWLLWLLLRGLLIGRTDAEAEAPILWSLNAKNLLIRKDPDPGKDWRQEEKGTTEDEMVGWHHRLNGHEFEQTQGDGEGQGSLACCRPWGHKQSDMT